MYYLDGVLLHLVSFVVTDKHVGDRHTVKKVPGYYVDHGYHETTLLFFVDGLFQQEWYLGEYFNEIGEKEDSELEEHLVSGFFTLDKHSVPM